MADIQDELREVGMAVVGRPIGPDMGKAIEAAVLGLGCRLVGWEHFADGTVTFDAEDEDGSVWVTTISAGTPP